MPLEDVVGIRPKSTRATPPMVTDTWELYLQPCSLPYVISCLVTCITLIYFLRVERLPYMSSYSSHFILYGGTQ